MAVLRTREHGKVGGAVAVNDRTNRQPLRAADLHSDGVVINAPNPAPGAAGVREGGREPLIPADLAAGEVHALTHERGGGVEAASRDERRPFGGIHVVCPTVPETGGKRPVKGGDVGGDVDGDGGAHSLKPPLRGALPRLVSHCLMLCRAR